MQQRLPLDDADLSTKSTHRKANKKIVFHGELRAATALASLHDIVYLWRGDIQILAVPGLKDSLAPLALKGVAQVSQCQ